MKNIAISVVASLLIVFCALRILNWAQEYDRFLYLDSDESISYKTTLTAVWTLNEYTNKLCQFPSNESEKVKYRKCRDFYMRINGWESSDYANGRAKEALDALHGWRASVSNFVLSITGSKSHEFDNHSHFKKDEYIIDRSRYTEM